MQHDLQYPECSKCLFRNSGCMACQISILGLAFNNLLKSIPYFGTDIKDKRCNWYILDETAEAENKTP